MSRKTVNGGDVVPTDDRSKASRSPTIEPVKVKQFDVKQSKYHQCGTLPIRSVLLGPSGAGKGIVLQNMIMDIYDKCFERVYIFSPSVHVDQTWVPVKEYL